MTLTEAIMADAFADAYLTTSDGTEYAIIADDDDNECK